MLTRSRIAVAALIVAFGCPAATQTITPQIGGGISSGGVGDGGITPPYNFVAPCTQGATFLARTSGFSEQQKRYYDTAICGLVTAGTFAKLDFFHWLAAPNQAASLLNIVSSSYSLTANGTCTFGALAGWMGDGSSCYLNPSFDPATAGGHYAVGNNSLGVGVLDPRQTQPGSGNSEIGGASADFSDFDYISPQCSIASCGGASAGNYFVDGGSTLIISTPTAVNGNFIQSLSGGTLTAYFNGVSIGIKAATQTELPGGVVVLAIDLPGVPSIVSFSTDSLYFDFAGSGLTQADVTAIQAAVTTLSQMMTGAPVAAAHWGFQGTIFSDNFSNGLADVDVNATFAPTGFNWYPSGWLGSTTPSPANSYSYSGGLLTVNNPVGGSAARVRMSTRGETSSYFTGTIVGNLLTVSGVLSGSPPIAVGQVLAANGSGLTASTSITSFGSGTGGIGTYNLSASSTIAIATNFQGQSSVGQVSTFKPGGYYEMCGSFDPTLFNTTGGEPTFWMQDIAVLYASNGTAAYSTAARGLELDLINANSTGTTPFSGADDWTVTAGGGIGTTNITDQNLPTPSSGTQVNCYETLWVLTSQNGGTGMFQSFVNQVFVSTTTYSATGGASPAATPSNPTGVFTSGETGNFVLLVDGGTQWPMNVSKVRVLH